MNFLVEYGLKNSSEKLSCCDFVIVQPAVDLVTATQLKPNVQLEGLRLKETSRCFFGSS